jgi:hypothetical protein
MNELQSKHEQRRKQSNNKQETEQGNLCDSYNNENSISANLPTIICGRKKYIYFHCHQNWKNNHFRATALVEDSATFVY